MKFKRMGHVAIQVADMERSLHFYRDLLGLKTQWSGSDWANLHVGQDDLSLVRREGARHPPHIGFRVESLDELRAVHAELQGRGVKVEALVEHRDKTWSFYFQDPDGNFLEALWDPREFA